MRKLFSSAVSAMLSAAFIFSGSVTVSAFEARFTEPQRNNQSDVLYYYSDENIFHKLGYGMANCTAYAWGRTYEILGTKPKLSTGNAGRWYKYNADNHIYSYGSEPKPGAVACWDKFDSINGHVAVIENVSSDKNTVTISESQWNGQNFRLYSQPADSSGWWNGYRFLGYIYTDDTSAKFYGDSFRISLSESSILTYTGNTVPELKSGSSVTSVQNFRFEPLNNGNYRIWSAASGKCLGLSNGNVILSEVSDVSDTSEWALKKEDNGLYTICRPENTDNVLSVNEHGTVLAKYSSDSRNFWNITRVTGTTPLSYTERQTAFVLEHNGSRREYFTDEYLDLSGIRFIVNGSEVADPDFSKLDTYYDFSTPGDKTVTVKYGEFTAEYTVTVIKPAEGLEYQRNNVLFSPVTSYVLDLSSEFNLSDLDINGDNVTDAADVLLMFR